MGVNSSCGCEDDGFRRTTRTSKGHLVAKTAKEWGYEAHNGPDTWFDKYEAAQGKQQSPIDLQICLEGGSGRSKLKEGELQQDDFSKLLHQDDFNMLKVSYNTTKCTVTNNGHTVQWTPENGGFVNVEGRVFELLQFHFHIPSEHTFNSEPKALEIHFVHQEKSSGTLLVLGHLFDYGKYNDFIHNMSNCSPPGPGEQLDLPEIDLSTIPNLDGSYMHYQGSLTTPPCSEGVMWYVNKSLGNISHAQIAWFQKSIPFDNARPIQNIHDRELSTNLVSRCGPASFKEDHTKITE